MQASNKLYRACLLGLTGGLLSLSTPLFAADAKMTEKPGVPTLADMMAASGVDLHGHVDLSYTYASTDATSTAGSRVYDDQRNSFNVQAVDLTLSRLPKDGFGALLNVTAGEDADVVNADSSSTDADQFDVTQAYAHYAAGPLMVIGGKFVTLAGAEVIKSPANSNFSRSILFGNAQPSTHTGVRAYYTVNDMLGLTLGVNNGWDNLKDDNGDKTLELAFSLAPMPGLSLATQVYSGKEASTTTGVAGSRTLVDIVLSYTPMDPLTLVLNYDTGGQKDAVTVGETAKWSGLAAYINYKLGEQWRVSYRGEMFDDKDGFKTGTMHKWKESTLTLAFMPDSNVELRAEVRGDKSDKEFFTKKDGSATKSQNSFAIEGIYKF